MVAGALDLGKGTQPPNPASGDGRLWIDGDGNVYALEDDGTNTAVGGGGSMSSFILAADSGTAETVADGDTLTIAGGTGIDTVVSTSDKVTVAIDSSVATLTGTQTLTNKTLTTPTVGDFSNATHNHQDAAGGGTLALAAISGAGTMAAQNADSVAITGGAIDNTVIGASSAAAGAFTDLDVSGDAAILSGGQLRFEDASGVMRGQLALNESGATRVQLNMYAADTSYLGTPFEFDATTNATRFFGDASFTFGSLTLGVDTVADVNNTRSLGSTSLRWLKGWFTDIDSINAVNVSSDARYKQDVRTIAPERGLALVLALTPRTFRRIGDDTFTHMGFVAQEIESALRRTGHDNMSVVKTDEETGDKSVAYTEIIAAQAAAIQALEQRITELERKVQ